MLAHTKLDPDFSIPTLARRADGLSGSDLRETCRNAAMAPVRELMREKGKSGKEGLEEARKEVSLKPNPVRLVLTSQGFKVRPLRMSDFVLHDSHAYAHVDPSRRGPRLADEPLD